MSVEKSKQKVGDMRVVTLATNLASYTLEICSNEKHFPKRYRWCITSKIVDSAINIHNWIWAANKIFMGENPIESDFEIRHKYQTLALAETYKLLAMIDIAKKLFGIESGRVEFWARQIYDVQGLLRNWRKSDKDRFMKHKGNN